MNFSEDGKVLLKELEGVKTKVYDDSAGLPTIGIGHLLTKDEIYSGKINISGQFIKYQDGLTLAHVGQLLTNDLRRFERTVETFVRMILRQNQFDALVIFAFNIGVQAFNESTLLKMLNNGQYDAVPHQMRRWIYSAGKINEGLKNRREKTIKHWLGQAVETIVLEFDIAVKRATPAREKRRVIELCYETQDKQYEVSINEAIGRLTIELTGDWDIK